MSSQSKHPATAVAPSFSPLFMVTQEPALNRLVAQLGDVARELREHPGKSHRLVFSRAHLQEVRDAWAAIIRRGERRLHRLCELICGTFLPSEWELESVVLGELPDTQERFTLAQPLSRDDLYRHTDLDLGTRMLERVRLHDGEGWRDPRLIANVVEYQPLEPSPSGIHKLVSRIKAEEEIWNKVADEIFHLDAIVERDKVLRELGRYVKDVFGLKLVVGDDAAAVDVQTSLEHVRWPEDQLAAAGVAPGDSTRRLNFIEIKDYLGEAYAKKSGWRAIKSVVTWWDKTFEIQVQPLGNYLRERERSTRESHTSFKLRREALRDEVASQLPLFGFYRDLLRWLFVPSDGAPAPSYEDISVELTD